MNTKKKFHFSAPARRVVNLRLISIIMLAAMLLGMLPVQPAAARTDLSRTAASQRMHKGVSLPTLPTVPVPALRSDIPGTRMLSEYPPPEIRKSDDPDPVAGSAPLTYTLQITNPLSSAVGGFVVTDTLPAGVTFVSAAPSQGSCSHAAGVLLCSLGSLTAQASATIIVNVTTPAAPVLLTNLAEVVDARGEPVSTTQQTMVMPSDLSITKIDLIDPAEWDQPLTYTLAVTNSGPYAAQNVIVTDTLPAGATFQSASTGCTENAGVVTCNLGTMAVGTSTNLSITILPPPGNIRNLAAVFAQNPDPNPADNLAEEWTAVQPVDLTISKHAEPSFVLAGDLLTYTLVVTNQGSLVAPSVVITDRLPAEVAFISASPGCAEVGGVVTCTIGTLNPGASATATILVTPIALPADGPLYSLRDDGLFLYTLDPLNGNVLNKIQPYIEANTIRQAGGLDVDPTTGVLYAILWLGNDDHRWLVTLDPINRLVTPIGDTEAAGHRIFDITFDDEGTLWAVTWNEGFQPNSLVTIDKTNGAVTWMMNTGTSFPQTIAWNPDDSLLYNLYGENPLLQTIQPGTWITNSIPINGTLTDFHSPGSLDYDLNARLFLVAEWKLNNDHPDLYHLFADGTIVDKGDIIGHDGHYTSGLAKLTNDATNLAAVSSAGVEINPTDNFADAHTTIDAPELVITKTDNPAQVELNAALTYNLLIENISPYTSTGVLVTDTLPAGVTFVSAAPSQGGCGNGAGGIVTCTLGTISPYASASIVIVVNAPNTPGTITNRAEAVDDRIAYTIDLEDTLVEPVDLSLTKVDNSDPVEGERLLTYTLTIHNNSIYMAQGVVVTDTLPSSVIYENAIPSQGSPCIRSGLYDVVCALGNINPGSSATIEIGVIPQSPNGKLYNFVIENKATVSSTNTELNPANNTDLEETNVVFPQLSMDTIDTPDPADPLSPLTYTIDITNISIYTALGVMLENHLSPAMGFVSISASQGSGCGAEAGGVVTCSLGTISPAASARVTITVTTPLTPGVYTNMAIATDDRVANTIDEEDTPVAPADLEIIKYDNPEPVTIGNPLTYTLVITNHGPYPAQNVVISDTLPDKVVFFSVEPASGTCAYADLVVTCNIGDLDVDTSASIEIVVTPIDIPPPSMLLSIEKDYRRLFQIELDNGALIKLWEIRVPGYTVSRSYDVDFDPITQYLYALLLLETSNPITSARWLVRIDLEEDPAYPGKITGTPIVNTQQDGHWIADITFDDNGTLWAVTGRWPAGYQPQSLVTVDMTTGEVTYIMQASDMPAFGVNEFRQGLAYNPDNGLLYMIYSWRLSEIWYTKYQSIDPVTLDVVEIPLSLGSLTLHEIGALEYDIVERNFLLGEAGTPNGYFRLSLDGEVAQLGTMGLGPSWVNGHNTDGMAISSPVLNNYAHASALNPDLHIVNNTYREPTEPIPHPFAGTLGNRVWEDRNGNGIQDAGEPGMAGVTVHLYKQGWGHLVTATTDADGYYEFKYLIPVSQTYTVTIDVPADYYITMPGQGGDDELDSDFDPATGVSPLIVLPAIENGVFTYLDAGLYRLTSLGDRAWHDLDLDGFQDTGEPGFSNIPVSLYDGSDILVGTDLTDVNGRYDFTDLIPGVYWLSFDVPSGYGFSPQYQVNPAADSDPDLYGNTAPFTLYSGTPDPTRDAGIASHYALDVYNSIAPNPVDEGGSVELTGGYYDPDFNDIYTATVDWGDGFSSPALVGGALPDYVFTATHTYADGNDTYTLTITIEDNYGNSYAKEASASTRNISPTLTIGGAPLADEGITYTLALSPVSDPGDDTLSACSIDWGDGTPIDDCLSAIDGSIDHTFPNGPQVYTVTLDLEDEDGTYAKVDWITVTVNNLAPIGVEDVYPTDEDQVLVVSPPGVLENDLDVPADPLTATLQTGPAVGSLKFSPDGSFIYTPTLDYNGIDQFTYIVSDGLAWSEPTIATILVGAINDPPVVDAGADQTGSEGSPIAFSGSYTDNNLRVGERNFAHVNQPTINWAFGDGEFASGTLTPTHAYGDNGIYTVILTVTDDLGGVGTDTLVVTITNAAPSLDLLPDRTAAPNIPFDFTITFSDTGWLDSHTLTVTWGDGDENVYELAAGVLTHQAEHTYTAVAIYTATITLQDDDGGADSQQFAITVRTPRVYLPTILAK